MNKLNEIIKISDIHAEKIRLAQNRLQGIFPIDVEKFNNLKEEEFLFIELLVNRFSKLQDFIGTKLIDSFFEIKAEIVSNMTMIDKINRLERLGVIKHTSLWVQMIEVRNHLVHEYPNHPEITIRYINQVFELSSELLHMLDSIKINLSIL
jgi:hypothetical protein